MSDLGLAREHELPPVVCRQCAGRLAQLVERKMKHVLLMADDAGVAEAAAEFDQNPANLIHRALVDPEIVVFLKNRSF